MVGFDCSCVEDEPDIAADWTVVDTRLERYVDAV